MATLWLSETHNWENGIEVRESQRKTTQSKSLFKNIFQVWWHRPGTLAAWLMAMVGWNLGPHARQGLLGKLRLKDGKLQAHLSVLSRLCQKWVNSFVAFYSVRIYKFTGDISFLGWSLPSSPLISVKTWIILYQFVLPTLTPKDDTLCCNYIYTCTYV